MKFISKIILSFGGAILLCNCNQKSTSSPTILFNDSITSDTVIATPTTNEVRGIIEAWCGEPFNKIPSKVHQLSKYDRRATETLKNKLWSDVINQYDRSAIVQHYKQYFYAVNGYLSDYTTTKFYTQITLKSLEPEELEFALDTFKINETCRLMMSEVDIDDNSTLSRCYLYKFYAEEYLIYKYYTKTMDLLKDEDKDILKANQEQWEKSLNANWDIEDVVKSYKYTGGGSMWKNITYTDKRPRSEFLFRIYKHLKSFGL